MSLQKHLILFLTIVCGLGVVGQSNYADRGWSAGIWFSPDLCYRLPIQGSEKPVESDYYDHDVPKFGYHFGAGARYKTKGIFCFDASIGYARMGYNVAPHYPNPNDTTLQSSSSYSGGYIDVPLKLTLLTGKNALQFIASVAFIPSIHVSSHTKSRYTWSNGYSETEEYEGEFSEPTLFTSVSAGCCLSLTEQLKLSIQPEYKIELFYHTTGNAHVWSLGLNIAAFYSL